MKEKNQTTKFTFMRNYLRSVLFMLWFGSCITSMGQEADSLSTNVDSLSTNVDSLSTNVDSLSTNVDSLVTEELDSVWLTIPTDFGDFGVFIEGSMLSVPGPGNSQELTKIGGGISFRKLVFGGFVSEVNDLFEKDLIFPNTYQMKYKYGGLYLGSHIIQKKPFEVDFRLGYGWGDIVWSRKETEEDFLRDEFSVLIPELVVTYVPITYIRIFATGGYRKMNKMNISNIAPTELDGLTFGFGIRIGFYK